MNTAPTLLITGASGFLGTYLADEAAKQGYQLVGIDLRAPLKPHLWSRFTTSSLENADLDQLLKGFNLAAVCHLAGGASVALSVNDPYGDFSSLLPGTARIALYLLKVQPQAQIFFFSSAAVYGNPIKLPISEQTPLQPISPYGIHKALAESLLANYSRAMGLKATIFRIFSVYGPGLRKQLIYDVSLRAMRAAALGERSIQLFGTGLESRDFMYVEDLCKAVLTVLESSAKSGFDVYNLGSGTENTVANVANCIVKHLDIDIEITFDGKVPKGDPLNWRADINKLSQLGFKTQYTIDDGLKQVAYWAKALA
ncbi:NAD-dependent epimerase/dehydratase family protein [Mucilaginibacter dorajii]|uniref:SDR family oxidoreductase n=1 Tax=Mucilaginibacter dorajii TaxID=692994 RepID=A0ABP7QNL9_9SPHI|nr:NAD-dependent epimerase/dehydratase family protein [Mucilaginibacter dorajii]MCS3733789.1 UDP-glucose 4-epimerase [Mucilaginibacter dorajii]